MKRALLFCLICLLLTSCADAENVKDCLVDSPAGFWSGLWHGWIASVAFLISLFDGDVAIYAVNNTGRWCDFGFVLGIGGFGSSVNKAITK